ncbi:hypothetical protein [Gracilimonas sp.]|uniref:hypothetical protein n=1 Tax=Gracilimonas sp. TaxID=1974203 RepID=UPI0028715E43|nr:hypothetical protein [Gracilimonas sp.]
MKKLTVLVIALAISMSFSGVQAQNIQDNFRIDGVMFFTFEHDMTGDSFHNQFTIKRGYVNFRHQLSDRLNARITQDVTIDREGDGLGDIELRLKYAYVEYDIPDFGFFNEPVISAGVTSRPWINFEQEVNDYRSQKSMFLDQNDFLPSADYGVVLETGVGESLDEPGLSSNDSRYGSFAIGVYNGGGYSSIEENNNKVVEGRLSVRPAAEVIPGFQVTAFGAVGKGNSPTSPDFNIYGAGLTYESRRFNAVLQGFQSTDDIRFEGIVSPNPLYYFEGWSIFGEFQPVKKHPIFLTGRTEQMVDQDQNRWIVKESVFGIAWVFKDRSKIILNYSHRESRAVFDPIDFSRIELIGEIRF